jgi:hypothetical protein
MVIDLGMTPLVMFSVCQLVSLHEVLDVLYSIVVKELGNLLRGGEFFGGCFHQKDVLDGWMEPFFGGCVCSGIYGGNILSEGIGFCGLLVM